MPSPTTANPVLSRRVQNITPSLTLAITAKAKQLKQQGVDVISLSAGEPDFDTPDAIKQAAIRSIQAGNTKYTPASGSLELREAISEKLRKENQLTYSPDQIVVSCGAKHSIYNILQVLIDEGDEAITISPYWLSYPEMITLAGGKSVILKTRLEDGFQFTPDALEKLITSKTKVIIINSPSNPAGTVYPKALLEQIGRAAVSKNCFVLSDEIYEKLIFDGETHYSIAALSPEIYERTITIGGASKAYSMTGWRLGFSASPKAIAAACASLQSHSTSNPTSFAQTGYVEALQNAEGDVTRMNKQFEKRRDLIFKLVSRIDKLKAFKAQGAFYLFVDVSATGLTSMDFANRLLGEAKVAVVPGISFGHDEAVRMSFAASEEQIEAAIGRISGWIKQL